MIKVVKTQTTRDYEVSAGFMFFKRFVHINPNFPLYENFLWQLRLFQYGLLQNVIAIISNSFGINFKILLIQISPNNPVSPNNPLVMISYLWQRRMLSKLSALILAIPHVLWKHKARKWARVFSGFLWSM